MVAICACASQPPAGTGEVPGFFMALAHGLIAPFTVNLGIFIINLTAFKFLSLSL